MGRSRQGEEGGSSEEDEGEIDWMVQDEGQHVLVSSICFHFSALHMALAFAWLGEERKEKRQEPKLKASRSSPQPTTPALSKAIACTI